MKTCLLTVALMCLPFAMPVRAEEPRFGLGLYVVVDDIPEARDYYRRLFEAEPVTDLENFVGFRLEGGLFSLFAAESFTRPLARGNGVVPYIRVDDIESEFERVKGFTAVMIDDAIVDEGVIKLFMFEDPSGNPLEFYSLTGR